jgi:hypothetical protein
MRKGFMSERDSNPCACDLRRVALGFETNKRRSEAWISVRGVYTPKRQYGAPLLSREFALGCVAGAR